MASEEANAGQEVPEVRQIAVQVRKEGLLGPRASRLLLYC